MQWHEIINAVRTAQPEDVLALACPECGGAMKIEFVSTERRGAIYVECTQCRQTVRATGIAEVPSWVDKLGRTITTKPAASRGV